MHIATVKMESVAAYSQSRVIQSAKKQRESHKDFELRTWKERMHTDDNDEVFIPPMALKNGLSAAAKYLSMPLTGKKTFTKIFESAILVFEPIMLGIKGADVQGEWHFLNSDGVRGSGKRVWKCYPVIPSWSATATVHVLDDAITKPVFEKHLVTFGSFIGVGRFRPQNNGFYGRLVIKGIEWAKG